MSDPTSFNEKLHQQDPDLHDKILEIQRNVPELRESSMATALCVLAWFGVDVMTKDPGALHNCGIFEKNLD